MTNKKIKKRQDCIIKQIVQFGLYIEQMEEETHEELARQMDIITELKKRLKNWVSLIRKGNGLMNRRLCGSNPTPSKLRLPRKNGIWQSNSLWEFGKLAGYNRRHSARMQGWKGCQVICSVVWKTAHFLPADPKMTRFERKGYCWVIGKCDWWNPPEDLMILALSCELNFCMKCWEFKKWKWRNVRKLSLE